MVCPIGAIGREASGRVEIKHFCMGIGKCAKGCPYGVISLVSVDQIKKPAGRWGRFTDRFKKRRLPKPDTAGSDPTALARLSRRKRYSIKCDLCEGFPGPACERNCPTGAARRLNPTSRNHLPSSRPSRKSPGSPSRPRLKKSPEIPGRGAQN